MAKKAARAVRPKVSRMAAKVGVPAPASNRSSRGGLPIVGIGASAGGLEALEQFMRRVPADSAMAFVVVQHLDPTHKGAMVELLQRATVLPVAEVRDRVKVAPGHVYVIPPNRDLSILHGVLHLVEPAAPRGLRLPIDHFFRTLAEDQQDQSIGVILSGMGSDGTLGLRAIKEHAGAAFVQTPESAKFDGMPRSAIDAGLADIVASPDELPGRIAAFLKSLPGLARPSPAAAERDQGALDRIIILLREQTGYDFSHYKKSGLYRRIERRMGLHQLAKISDYVRYLSANGGESSLLFKELLIGVTSFFRDPAVWEQLKNEALPGLLETRTGRGPLRAWVAGCSTGEEAYSLAIVLREAMNHAGAGRDTAPQIFATDIDKDAVERARTGAYLDNIGADVSPERLRRFFIQEEHGYRVNQSIREMVVFAAHNLLSDPPFTKLDVLSCRNLLIYLEPDLQKRLMSLFHYCLNPGGILLLGTAETVGSSARLFTPVAGKSRIFRRSAQPTGPDQPELPPVFGPARASSSGADTVRVDTQSSLAVSAAADRLLLESYAPAAVLVNHDGDIVYVGGKTGRYLEPAAGKANWNLFAMARPGLDRVIHSAFREAVAGEKAITLSGITVKAEGDARQVNVTIRPLSEPPELRGTVLVVFADAPAEVKVKGRAARLAAGPARQSRLEAELRLARDEARATQEEMQTTQEELRSANEELQSSNEELQSTNEELTTSKEEMQSMNEELQTLNQELQSKVDELMRVSDDMKNLLNSTNIATLFLDDALNVRRFTSQATQVFKLLPGDVGRPITDLASDLDYPEMIDDIRGVLSTLVFSEKSVGTRDGRWYAVRIMPYRTQEDRIDGVVLTFSDITKAKQLEAQLRAREGNGGDAATRGHGDAEKR